jgi:YidC/Oxa1 family membrane protein insertase
MEENKLDIYQIIGFLFLIAAFFWWFNVTIPDLEKNALEEKEIISQSQSQSQEINNNNKIKDITEVVSTSINSTVIGSRSDSEEIVIENDDVIFKFNTKGGSLTELQLKGYVDYKGDDLFLIKNNNQNISLSFDLKNGNKINTSDYNFSYEMLREGKVNVLKLSLIISDDQSVSFVYKIPKSGYMIDFGVKSSGFYSLINADSNVNLNWSLDAFRQAKSIDYENRYSQLMYQYEGDDTDYLSSYSDSDDSEDSVSWISYGQHFFNSILILDTQTDNVQFESKKTF